jgi:hypothetical protein
MGRISAGAADGGVFGCRSWLLEANAEMVSTSMNGTIEHPDDVRMKKISRNNYCSGCRIWNFH